MQPAVAQLTSLQSAAIKAVLESDAAIPAIARGLNLSLEGLLDLMDAPAVRTILDRILALETIRRKIGVTVPVSASLRALTALLDRSDAEPVEQRRAATTILRTAASMCGPEYGRAAAPRQAAEPLQRQPTPAPPQPGHTPPAHTRAEPAWAEPRASPVPVSLPSVAACRPFVAAPPFVPRPGRTVPSPAASLVLAAGAPPRPP